MSADQTEIVARIPKEQRLVYTIAPIKAAAITAFARGEITAAAMMAQITIGAPASTGPVR